MPQSQDIHLDNSEIHRGPTARTAACPGKHLDACICCETCARQAHASLAQEMHALKSLLGTCITCVPHLKACMHPNRTSINNFSIQMLQSAQGMTPCTRTIDPDACNSLGAHISQTQRCTRQAHACLGERISCPP